MFLHNKVRVTRPEQDQEDWFNIFVIHQVSAVVTSEIGHVKKFTNLPIQPTSKSDNFIAS